MTSEKQLIANKQNAQSAGVKTQEGKTKIRHNALQHGLTSESILSEFESHEESQKLFEETVEGLKASLKPEDYLQELLVINMAKGFMKLRRFDVWESLLFDEDVDVITSQYKFEIPPRKETSFNNALKYKTSIENQITKALDCLIKAKQCSKLDLF